MTGRNISVLIIRPASNDLDDIRPHVPKRSRRIAVPRSTGPRQLPFRVGPTPDSERCAELHRSFDGRSRRPGDRAVLWIPVAFYFVRKSEDDVAERPAGGGHPFL
jgi:hypothetical protein